ncbi:MAG: AEC family transporter [Ruminococcaceae bacterium]|nr:AEC family transporter [Oscillospiraceae bacterium]
MEIFKLALQQLMMMASLILIGFFLRKKELVPSITGTALSKLETFVLLPALTFVNQLRNCTVENFTKHSSLILYGAVFVFLAVGLAYPVSKLFVRNSKASPELEYQRNVYKYALTFGNYGFMGNFIVLGIWGDAFLFQYLMLTFIVGIVCHSWGLYILIPKGQCSFWANMRKSLTAPPIIALVLGMICGLLNVEQYVPQFAISAFDNLSPCMGPIAMLLAGMIIGEYDIRKLLSDKRIYIVTALRLIVIPAFFMLLLNLIGASKDIMTLILIAFATPLGMNTIVFPAAYGGDTSTGASMTVVSHTLSVITIPLMYYLFIVIL